MLDVLGAGRTSLAQLRSIVGLAHALVLTLVAEDVERPEQLLRLRDLGCDLGQGFLFSRPRPLPCFLDHGSGG